MLDDVDKAVVITGIAILIVPLLVFISIASRIGGPARMRRLAAIRLVGAGSDQLRRFAVTEGLIAAVLGLLVGTAGYLLIRQFAASLSLGGTGFFPGDISPSPVLAMLTGVLVPLLAAVSVSAGQRRAAVEPLGVTRSGRRSPRKLWWRLGFVAIAGVALVTRSPGPAGFVPGVALAMICIPVLVPYLVEQSAGRLSTGGIGWQFAVRGLRADSTGTAARSVSGLAVVLCAAVALLPLLSYAGARVGENTDSVPARGGIGYLRVVGTLQDLAPVQHAVTQAAGSERVTSVIQFGSGANSPADVRIASCAAIEQAGSVSGCHDGAAIYLADRSSEPALLPGAVLKLSVPGGGSLSARPSSVSLAMPTIGSGSPRAAQSPGLYLTPAVAASSPTLKNLLFNIDVQVSTSGLDDAGFDRVRNALADYGWRFDDSAFGVGGSLTHLGQLMTTARTGLLIGGALILLVAVLSMMVLAVEQITERRRALTMAVASGVPRSVLARAAVFGTLIPAVLAVLLADVVGILITLTLNPLLRADLRLNPLGLLVLSVATLVLVVAISAATLPAMRRLTRPEDLRTE